MDFWKSDNTPARDSCCFSSTAIPSEIQLGVINNPVARINIYSSGTLVDIPVVKFDLASDVPLINVFVTSENVVFPEEHITAWGGLSSAGLDIAQNDEDRVRFACALVGDLNGTVRVGQIRRLQVDSVIRGTVEAHYAYGPDFFSIGAIDAWQIASTADILADEGISFVKVRGGDWAGTTTSPLGIAEIQVDAGDVTGTIDAGLGIFRTTVVGNVSGQILSSGVGNSVKVDIGTLDGLVQLGHFIQESGPAIVRGRGSGTLQLSSVAGAVQFEFGMSGAPTSGLIVDGDVSGSVLVGRFRTGGFFPEGIGYIHVGGSILGTTLSVGGAGFLIASSVDELTVDGNVGVTGPLNCPAGYGITVDYLKHLTIGGGCKGSFRV